MSSVLTLLGEETGNGIWFGTQRYRETGFLSAN